MTIAEANAVARLLRLATGRLAENDTPDRIREDVGLLELRAGKALLVSRLFDPHALDAAIRRATEGTRS